MQPHIFQSISTQLQCIAGLKWVDWQQGQSHQKLDNLPLPAALISFADLRWQDHLERVQQGELTLHVELYLPHIFTPTRRKAIESPAYAHTMAALQLPQAVIRQLHGFSSEHMVQLLRVREEPLPTTSSTWGFRQTYCTLIIDDTLQITHRKTSVATARIAGRFTNPQTPSV